MFVTRFLKKYFIRGILIVLPIGGTVLLCNSIYKTLYDTILVYTSPFLKYFHIESIAILNLALLFLFILLVGILGGNFVGTYMMHFFNNIIKRMPLISTIYGTLQQLLHSIFQNNNNFSKVVLLEYPRKGLYSIGFVTTEDSHSVLQDKKHLWTIFIPTTPNPTSGVLLFVPQEELQVLDITVKQAAKMVMSAGVIKQKNS